METGRILSIDPRGIVQVQLIDRVIEAQIMSGGAHIGDRINGPMQPGIQTWICSLNRTVVVNVQMQPMRAAPLAYAVA
ncbi:MAG: hypothetical protein JWL98_1342 [Xanthomonadaceae bacterium]|jgi:hypothetical protein|nr:hypothetical protein [Xanthomonadaceae bacterium]